MHRTPAVFLGPLFRFIAPLIWKKPGPSPARLLDSFLALASASFALPNSEVKAETFDSKVAVRS